MMAISQLAKSMNSRISTQESRMEKFNDELADTKKKTSENAEEVKVIETKVAKDHQEINDNKKNVQTLELQSKQHDKTLEMLQNRINTLEENSKRTEQSMKLQINDLQKKYDQVKVPKWPLGSYCILANGSCPPGFKSYYGYLRAITMYSGYAQYLRAATFGSSRIQCHGDCGRGDNYHG